MAWIALFVCGCGRSALLDDAIYGAGDRADGGLPGTDVGAEAGVPESGTPTPPEAGTDAEPEAGTPAHDAGPPRGARLIYPAPPRARLLAANARGAYIVDSFEHAKVIQVANDGATSPIHDVPDYPKILAVDDAGIYVAYGEDDSEYKPATHIARIALDGTTTETVVDARAVTGIALDATYMYWSGALVGTAEGSESVIMRVPRAGGTASLVASDAEGIASLGVRDRVYWGNGAGSSPSYLRAAPLDGVNAHGSIVFAGPAEGGIGAFARMDRGTVVVTFGSFYGLDDDDDTSPVFLSQTSAPTFSLATDGRRAYWANIVYGVQTWAAGEPAVTTLSFGDGDLVAIGGQSFYWSDHDGVWMMPLL